MYEVGAGGAIVEALAGDGMSPASAELRTLELHPVKTGGEFSRLPQGQGRWVRSRHCEMLRGDYQRVIRVSGGGSADQQRPDKRVAAGKQGLCK